MNRRSPRSLGTIARAGRQPRHETFMAITVLEMERHRRQREADRCRAKLAALEERIREIDLEVANMLAKIGSPPDSGAPPTDPTDLPLRY